MPQTLSNVFKGIALTGVFILPFIPLVVSNELFFPFITAKAFLFRVIVEIIVAAWLALWIFDRSYKPQFTSIVKAFGLFLVVIALADATGLNAFKSFWSNFERMEGWVLLVHLFGYLVVASTVLRTEKLWSYFWNTSLGVSVIVCFIGVLQLTGSVAINQGNVRLDARIGNATYLAIYLLFHIFIALYLFLRKKEKAPESWIYPAIAFFNVIILYFTATRGAILGLIFGGLLASLLIAIFEKERPKLRKGALGLIIVVGVLVGGFLLFKDSALIENSPVLVRFNPETLQSTADTRFQVWNIALEGFQERPLLGWGQENFNYVFNKYYDPQMYTQEQWFDRSHNVIFDWLIAGGILGLASYLLIIFFSIYTIWKGDFSNTERALLTGLIGAYVFQNLFVFDNLLSYFLFVSVLAYLSYPRTLESFETKSGNVDEISDSYRYVSFAIIVIGFITVGYFISYKDYAANQVLIKGFIDVQTGNHASAIERFDRALSYGSSGTAEIREQIAQTAMALARANVPAETKQVFFAMGRKALEDQINETPLDVRHYVLLGNFLNIFGMTDDAIAVIEKAVELSPKKQIILFELGTSYYYKKDYEKMYELFKRAYDLAPEFDGVKLIYAFSNIISGRDVEADELLSGLPREMVIGDNRIISAYQERGQFKKIIEILKERIVLNPTNYEPHLSLAATYVELGQRTDAVKELEEVIRLNPQMKAQAEAWIVEIKAGRTP